LSARAAVYYAPAEDDSLWAAGCTWLGRDPASGRTLASPVAEELTREPRLYGFHATLKPPMRLNHTWAALMEDAAALASRLQPFPMPALQVADLGAFLALREAASCPPLHALADACVTALDPHRRPAEPEEIARRRRAKLTPAQDSMLLDWGYPYVLGTWRFHMTLTRRLAAAEREEVRAQAAAHFAPALARERMADSICLFTQAAPDAPFLLAERLRLGG
jgi:putative phosphonate metabolism protein